MDRIGIRRLAGWHGASPTGRALLLALPAVWTTAVVALAFVVPGRVHVVQLLAVAPAIACAGTGERRWVLVGGACAFVGLLPLADGRRGHSFDTVLGHVLAIGGVLAASYLMTGRRARLTRELERVREVAAAAQSALLRSPPERAGGCAVAADYLSASRGALIGGDLYEVLETPHGLRVVLGDVRGHGLSAVGTVGALLGCFREAAHDEHELGGVLCRLDRALGRHLRERAAYDAPPAQRPDAPVAEEFATLLLLELRPGGGLTLVNCGHPWPYRITGGAGDPVSAEPLTAVEPLPPLGVWDPAAGRPVPHETSLPAGHGLFLHTDGAPEARDAAGEFFPLAAALAAAAGLAADERGLDPGVLVAATRTALLAHAAGRLADDVAMLALVRDAARVPEPRDAAEQRPARAQR